MSNLPSVKRDWREPRDVDNVPQSSEDEDAITRRQARRISD